MAATYTFINYTSGVRAGFFREDSNRIRYEWDGAALVLGAMSIYGENSNYPISQGDQDIATALNQEFRNPQSQVNRYWSPYDGGGTQWDNIPPLGIPNLRHYAGSMVSLGWCQPLERSEYL